MTATQLAALAARVEQAMREVNEIAIVLGDMPEDMLPGSFRLRMNLQEACRCVPRLSDCAETLRGMTATASK